ncbi:2TM domain-containing protein [Aquimarina celericrescens]|nr:2TM domain-containing protein [Aquimarina celericrescens]
MASAERKSGKIDSEQRELFENAQRRIKQKKRLTTHFVIFIAGSILFIILNVVLDFGKEFKLFGTDWFVWAILLWFFFYLIHAINVFFVNKLMGKEWETKQMGRLVEKQKKKIAELQQRVEKEHPLPNSNNNTSLNA